MNFKYIFAIGAYVLIIGLIQSSGGLNPNAVAHGGDIKVGDRVVLGLAYGHAANVTDIYGPDGMGRMSYKVPGLGTEYPDTERQWFDGSELTRVGIFPQFRGINGMHGLFHGP